MTLWQLFVTFFKLGAFTFGGGYAMIALLEEELVAKKAVDNLRRYAGHGGHCRVHPRRYCRQHRHVGGLPHSRRFRRDNSHAGRGAALLCHYCGIVLCHRGVSGQHVVQGGVYRHSGVRGHTYRQRLCQNGGAAGKGLVFGNIAPCGVWPAPPLPSSTSSISL